MRNITPIITLILVTWELLKKILHLKFSDFNTLKFTNIPDITENYIKYKYAPWNYITDIKSQCLFKHFFII